MRFAFRSRKYRESLQKLEPRENLQEAASQWIMRREQLPEYRFALELMSPQEKEAVFWRDWDRLDELAQRDLARAAFGERWYQLIAGYPNMSVQGKMQVLEALGHIHRQDVVDFLMGEMKREDEGIRLAAAGALKRQDPLLTIEPMLGALSKPEIFLASRIFDVLQSIGPKLVPIIITRLKTADDLAQLVMVQLLGAFGDETVLPLLAELAKSDDYNLRKEAAAAVCQIGTKASLPILNQLLLDTQWQIRLLACEAIKKGRFTEALSLLKRAALGENDVVVREMMQETIVLLEAEEMPTTFLWRRRGKGEETQDGQRHYSRAGHRNTGTNDFAGGAF